jgi:hypothetical protein
MDCVPEHLIDSADWQLFCSDGKRLPCHSLILSTASQVFAELLQSTVKPKDGERIDIPFKESSTIGEWLMKWVYQRKRSLFFNVEVAYHLAKLGHYLDSPGRPFAFQEAAESLSITYYVDSESVPVPMYVWYCTGLMEDCGLFLCALHTERPDFVFKALLSNDSGAPKKLRTLDWAVMARQCGMHRFLKICLDRLVQQKVSLLEVI